MRRLAILLLLAACSSSKPATTPDTTGLSPVAVQRIRESTSCTFLQGEHDTAAIAPRKAGTPEADLADRFVQVIDERMRQLGC